MSGILNKLGLGHKDHSTEHHAGDVAHQAGHTHTAKHESAAAHNGAATTTTTTTTTNNQGLNTGLNQSPIGTTAPYGSSTAASTTRTGAAYSNQGLVGNQTLASNQHINQTGRLSGDDAMTRSEEQLRVAKATVETGKAELNKTVEHVHVEQAVPVQRERVVIEREPITGSNLPAAMSGPAISEAHFETTLHEDRVAATKETVPIERIRLAKQVETSVESVGADLRKEHVDLTMHAADNIKTDSALGHSNLHSTDKFDTGARSGLVHDNITTARSGLTHDNLHGSSNIHTASNTRNI